MGRREPAKRDAFRKLYREQQLSQPPATTRKVIEPRQDMVERLVWQSALQPTAIRGQKLKAQNQWRRARRMSRDRGDASGRIRSVSKKKPTAAAVQSESPASSRSRTGGRATPEVCARAGCRGIRESALK
jgi:hypothetical protein